MLEKLKQISDRAIEVETALSDSAVYSDPQKTAKLLKEQKELAPYREIYAAILEYTELLADPELRADARAELDRLEEEAGLLLLPKNPDDDKSVILEIRGGAGGEEAALFAQNLLRMYTMYAEAKRFKFEIVNLNETELGGVKEVSALIESRGAYARFKYESGVHRVQRVPDTESGGRIHTSTVTVAVLPEAEEVDIDINPVDLQIDTFRSGGAGGQHVNKTESAIRITHKPTGLVVECQDERSQHKNKDRALKILRSKLLEQARDKAAGDLARERKSQVGTGDRSERIRTYNYSQGRVTDHRIGLTLYKLDAFLGGGLDEMIDALAQAEQAERLKAGTDEN